MNGVRDFIDALLLPIAKLVEWYARWSSRSSFNIPEPTLGEVMHRVCPVHFAGFYDDCFHDLFVSCLKDDIETVKAFDKFNIKVS